MAIICPTVTAYDPETFKKQLDTVLPFASRIHLDYMDGVLAPTLSPPLPTAQLPAGHMIDLHLMYQKPLEYIATVKQLKPSLVIIHAEAEGSFTDFAVAMQGAGIKLGVCLLQATSPEKIAKSIDAIDHVLVFSGNLGHYGGTADLSLLDKVRAIRQMKPTMEIGWDGGINETNAKQLSDAGVDVLNVGGFIQNAPDPAQAYATLKSIGDA